VNVMKKCAIVCMLHVPVACASGAGSSMKDLPLFEIPLGHQKWVTDRLRVCEENLQRSIKRSVGLRYAHDEYQSAEYRYKENLKSYPGGSPEDPALIEAQRDWRYAQALVERSKRDETEKQNAQLTRMLAVEKTKNQELQVQLQLAQSQR